ncbi:MAG: hypothetical protein EOP84_30080 [Verrucomicrobiaceae bacterium]|nr:MAG: hypothetical protein EOP84_30080 [Verrucomicrobiaceae bacterium]
MVAAVLATMLVRPLVVAYVPNWVEDLPAYAGTIDYAKVTHINVAFENPMDDDGNLSANPANDVLVEKAHAKGVKVLISIGGGGASGDKELLKRYFYLLSPSKRTGFVTKLADYVAKHNYDGLDVDIEGPSINGDYGPFIADLAKALKPKGKLLTSALSRGYGGDQVPSETLRVFDFINVMAYDGTGPWAPDRPGQHSSMELAKEAIKYFVDHGLSKEKAVLGVPFYGYGFGPDAKGDEWSFAKILAAYPGAEKVDQIGNTIYYNGIPTIEAKAKYVLDEGLGGVMIWSLNSDAKGENSLLEALNRVLNKSRG